MSMRDCSVTLPSSLVIPLPGGAFGHTGTARAVDMSRLDDGNRVGRGGARSHRRAGRLEWVGWGGGYFTTANGDRTEDGTRLRAAGSRGRRETGGGRRETADGDGGQMTQYRDGRQALERWSGNGNGKGNARRNKVTEYGN